MFDELSVQPNLQPNLKEGTVDGFEDFGYKKSDKMANHAQVRFFIKILIEYFFKK